MGDNEKTLILNRIKIFLHKFDMFFSLCSRDAVIESETTFIILCKLSKKHVDDMKILRAIKANPLL